MPIRKTRLSAAELEENRCYLRQLYAEGIDVEIPEARQVSSPLEITRGTGIGEIFDLAVGNTAYVIPLCIVARSRVIVMDYHIQSAWDDQIELPYLSERNGRYEFGRQTYMSEEVLNDRFEIPLTLNRGSIIQGLILAYGCQPIPEEVRNGAVPVQFTLTDTLHRSIQTDIGLVLERSVKQHDALILLRTELHVSADQTSDDAAEGGIAPEIVARQEAKAQDSDRT